MDLCGVIVEFSILFFISFLVISNIWFAFWADHDCDQFHRPFYHHDKISLCGSNDQPTAFSHVQTFCPYILHVKVSLLFPVYIMHIYLQWISSAALSLRYPDSDSSAFLRNQLSSLQIWITSYHQQTLSPPYHLFQVISEHVDKYRPQHHLPKNFTGCLPTLQELAAPS